MKKRIRLHIAYDGSQFFGWQRLGQGQPTIQETLEEILGRLFDQKIFVMGSGRTDAGVHARSQVAHFDTDRDLNRYKLLTAINSQTPRDIIVRAAYEAPPEFHAMVSAEKKTYKYYILNRSYPSAFQHRYSWWLRRPLDLEKLNDLTSVLLGEHDFASFRSQGSNVKTTVRRIFSAEWKALNKETLVFTVCGSGFLKQMVRNMVGTLVALQLKNKGKEELLDILNARDRRVAGPTAYPGGLFLHSVRYPRELDIKCRKL